ncbi:MAG: alpha-xenorhabdolysin family binary toxin subunit A [Okeania sp. SIO3I5]|uniref:alpha-xenorhabdolysin family binary toxin subunit A n=1 Tax=Okeania sp. SIO3I5 TaxID=2607805 RepID=UPI0013B6E4BA|nr:alpha-xenorhabdolysin family binary toxin subunit A [Okeania sp. SIO3I5]NEQ35707.1 alpha-xenorhabdolysin family binary toxin subunit A [Okeania sp. SIO3I5]
MSVKTLIQTRNAALASFFQDTGVEAEYTVEPKQVTNELLKLATGKTGQPEANEEDTGLILYPDSIKNLKYYERDGLALPNTESEVYTYLGGYESTIQGLTNADLLVTFQAIQANAGDWAGLESSIIDISVKLDAFSREMNTDGVRICDFLLEIILAHSEIGDLDPDKLEDPEYIQKILEDLGESPDIAESDASRLELSKRMIDDLTEKAQGYYDVANVLLGNLQTFKEGLIACSSDVNSKEKLCDELDIEGELEDAKAELNQMNARLKDLESQYDKDIGLCFTGIIGGVIGITITGGIFGKKAADTKKEIKALKEEIEELENTIDGLNRLLGAITTLDTSLESLFTVMIEAETGLNQILVVWQVIVEDLKISADACEAVQNSTDVFNLYINFLDTIDPWENIGGNAAMVTNAFNEALEEWAAEQND